MSRGQQNSKVDRVIELFREKRLYQTLKKPVALLIELILRTGATPVDIIHIQPEHIDRKHQTLTLHPHKKKNVPPSTHQLSNEAIHTFFSLKKPLHNYSIRRLQQLLKEETTRIGSTLTTPRSLRKEYLKEILSSTTTHVLEKTQLTSIQQRTILTPQEQQRLKTTSYNPRNKALILTLLQTGLRVQEVLLLQKKHLVGTELIISKDISHNQEQRTISLPPALHSYTPKKQFLFSSTTPLTQRRFEQICKEVAQKTNIKTLTPSILRATAIYNLSSQKEEDELLLQTGLQSSTLYTHGFLVHTLDETTPTTQEVTQSTNTEEFDERGDDDFMYHRSKLKDGGDTDE